jgi:hypothetical protein
MEPNRKKRPSIDNPKRLIARGTALSLVRKVTASSETGEGPLSKEFARTLEKLRNSVDKTRVEFKIRRQLTQVEFDAFADALSVNTTVTYLELTGTRCGERGAKALAEALRNNSTLVVMHLRRNCILLFQSRNAYGSQL